MSVGKKTIARLRDFNEALHGADAIGNDTCEICGRDYVKTFRIHRGKMSIELCGPCMNESIQERAK